jgi:hypothetical protein
MTKMTNREAIEAGTSALDEAIAHMEKVIQGAKAMKADVEELQGASNLPDDYGMEEPAQINILNWMERAKDFEDRASRWNEFVTEDILWDFDLMELTPERK